MSSAKVHNSGQASPTTSIAKLNAVRAASLSSMAPSISSLNDSTGINSATEQYLLAGDNDVYLENDSISESEKEQYILPHSSLDAELSPETSIHLQEDLPPFRSEIEVERQVESYEETIKQYEEPVIKKTRSFG